MKKKILVILLSALLLVGCPKPEPQIIYRTVEVEVPVYQIPKFSIPVKPVLPTNLLNAEDKHDHNTIGKAYISTVILLEGYVDSLVTLLQTIKNPVSEN